jgi:hypothetical protein
MRKASTPTKARPARAARGSTSPSLQAKAPKQRIARALGDPTAWAPGFNAVSRAPPPRQPIPASLRHLHARVRALGSFPPLPFDSLAVCGTRSVLLSSSSLLFSSPAGFPVLGFIALTSRALALAVV